MGYYTVNNTIKPMYGGTAIPITGSFPDWFYIDQNDNEHWWIGVQDTICADKAYGERQLNFYYKILSRNSDNSFVVSTGVYVDITFDIDRYQITADFHPNYTWLQVDRDTIVTIADVNSSQQQSTNFNSVSSSADIIGIPGILLDYHLTPDPKTNWPNKHICTCTYRYWLSSECDFVLTAAAKLNISNRIAVGAQGNTFSESVYLHFDNVPYITCPTEINDVDSFSIEYNFPDSSKLEYIQFSLLDDADNPIIDYKDASNTSNSYTFNLLEEDLAKLYTKFNTVNDVLLFLGVKFKNRSEDPIYMSFRTHFTIVKEIPTVSVSLRDDSNLVDAEEVFVEGLSDLHIIISPTAYKGASIVYTAIENGGQVYTNQNEVVFKDVTDKLVEVVCKDSRGNAVSKVLALDGWIPYISPTCSITAEAPNTDGYLPITLSGTYFNAYNSFWYNEFDVYYKYASSNPEHSVLDWTKVEPRPSLSFTSSYRYTATLELLVPNHADTYTVQLQFKDKFTTYTSNSVTVKSTPVFDWGQEDFNFNVPVNIVGDLTVSGSISSNTPVEKDPDYIVEQGTVTTGSGNSAANWVYRKWNSGIAECWCRKHISTAVNTAWGNLFVSGALSYTNITWGVTFTDIPVANITIAPNASGAFLIAGGSTSLTKDNTGGYEIARGSALASAGSFYINYYGIGRWK